MPKTSFQKQRIIVLRELLLKHTDENNPITMDELIKRLREDGLAAGKRTIEEDIEALIEAGLDIEKRSRPKLAYALLERDFTLQELKLLIDCVQASKFLSLKKTEKLTDKLCNLRSEHEGKQLKEQAHKNHVKSDNEDVYRNIKTINTAIAEKGVITFKYNKYLPSKEKQEKVYHVSPLLLIYEENNYYLLALERKENQFYASDRVKHYRVDCMTDVTVLDESRIMHDNRCNGTERTLKHIDMDNYTQYSFAMIDENVWDELILSMQELPLYMWEEPFEKWKEKFSVELDFDNYTMQSLTMCYGKAEKVTIQFPNHLAGVVFDRFGMDVIISKVDSDNFQITQPIAVSPQFYGWLFGLGTAVKIIDPPHVAQGMKDLLKEAYNVYTVPRNRKKKADTSE